MVHNGLKAVHMVLRLAWLAGTVGLLAVVVLPTLLPTLGRQVYVVSGASMEPAIPLGSIVVVNAADPRDVRVGDVVTYRVAADTVITHRVVAVTGGDSPAFQTKGDASGSADPVPVAASALVGRVELALPGVGYLMRTLDTPVGAGLAVAILGALLVLAWSTEEFLAPATRSAPAATAATQVP